MFGSGFREGSGLGFGLQDLAGLHPIVFGQNAVSVTQGCPRRLAG